jgi:bifunctional N-acetylglucosamine-1-phosphate-uridyltransferase/glucosamine-1-phosphate-acetyltransferase GlmU-like protein
VWDVLLARLASVTSRVHLVLSREGLDAYDRLGRPGLAGVDVTTSCQPIPLGMGDAVLGAIDHWRAARDVAILWGDQLGVSVDTLERTVSIQRAATAPSLTLPLVDVSEPYVHYELDALGTLRRVHQAREGDACPARGRSDVGLFALSTSVIEHAWTRYAGTAEARGARTGELNLLPFFAFLSREAGVAVDVLRVEDASEARGINTPEDLAFFRARMAG